MRNVRSHLMFNSFSNFSAPKCWTRSCTLPTGNVECTRKSRPPQQFSDARLDARLFNLEKSDGDSVLTGRIMYNFLPTFGGKKHGQKVGINQNPTFLPTFWQKKAGRKLDGFHITGNPPLSQDQNGCLTFMRQPLSIFYIYYQVSGIAAGG